MGKNDDLMASFSEMLDAMSEKARAEALLALEEAKRKEAAESNLDIDEMDAFTAHFIKVLEDMDLEVPTVFNFGSNSDSCLCLPYLWVVTLVSHNIRLNQIQVDRGHAAQVSRGILKHCPGVVDRDAKDEEIRRHFVAVALETLTVMNGITTKTFDHSFAINLLEGTVNRAHDYVYDLLISHAPEIDEKTTLTSAELRFRGKMGYSRHPLRKGILKVRANKKASDSSAAADSSAKDRETGGDKSHRNRQRAVRRIRNKQKQNAAAAAAQAAQAGKKGSGRQAGTPTRASAGSQSGPES